jgi:hypothetical protein
MNWKKILLIGIGAVIILLQLFPGSRPEVRKENPHDLLLNNDVPDTIASLLRVSCYDCHSNETYYPWYAYVVPVSWLLNKDVRVGRKNVNFSEWESYDKMDKAKILTDIADEVEEGAMPLPIYLLMHPAAKRTADERELIVDWTDEFATALFE